MALYLGNKKYKINLDGVIYCLNSYTTNSSMVNIGLLSSDNYILQDSEGVYLMPKITIEGTTIADVDSYILHDINGLYLTIKEDI